MRRVRTTSFLLTSPAHFMSTPARVLFVAGEVAPFADVSPTAALVRNLPEQLMGSTDMDARIMMPRYGTISPRKNRLHEVIRLSGTDIAMGEATEELKVRVASIPGVRLQVYFMDNKTYFKRKGLHQDTNGDLFDDNAERALFFGRSVLETVSKLRWQPDVVHAFGWVSSFVPLLLRSEYADTELFEGTKVVYTPDGIDAEAELTETLVTAAGLHTNGDMTGERLSTAALSFADASIFPPDLPRVNGETTFATDADDRTAQVLELYTKVRQGVPA